LIRQSEENQAIERKSDNRKKMTVEQYLPSSRLRPFIQSFLFIETSKECDNTVLPDTSIFMSLRYKGCISIHAPESIGAITANTRSITNTTLPTAVLSGIRDSSRSIHYHANTANLIIGFEPGAAAAFFREPVNELYDQSVPVDWLKNGAGLASLSEQLAERSTKKEQLALVEKALLSKLIRPAPDPLIAAAVKSIQAADGNAKIAALASQLYISRDALEKRFRASIGTSPKHFSSIHRLRKAIATHKPGKSLTDIALTAGYYDQAHFIRDFRAFTRQAPKQFFNERNFW
jgi:AraC-like DNA-binding protein